jgi:hypothetical protein
MTEFEEPQDTPEDTPTPIPEPSVPEDSDSQTDQAVDDIVRSEGDDELKAQDEAVANAVVMKLSKRERFKEFWHRWWSNPRKKWGTIAVLVLIVAGLFAVPVTRYDIIGLLVREKVTVDAVDSKTGRPVSGVEIQIGSAKAETDGEGVATLYPHTGSKHLIASKSYYGNSSQTVLVTLSATHNVFKTKLVALGRQVSVKVVNKITNDPVDNAEITAGSATAKTGKNGVADIVLPSSASMQMVSVSLGGYNTAQVSIDAGGDLSQNTVTITPAGKVYFLSNLSGTLDVVSTNLDGTDRQTVLAGTGSEDVNNTALVASPDWKYLALYSKRSGSNALYLIDTTNNDKLTTIDQGSNEGILTVGWSGDRFIYEVDHATTVSDWQADQETLKSFDPTTGQTLPLDQTQATGTSEANFAKQVYVGAYIAGNQVLYAKTWEGDSPSGSTSIVSGKQAELDSINADGSNYHQVKTFAPSSYPEGGAFTIGLIMRLFGPGELYLGLNDNGTNTFYTYGNGAVSSTTDVTADTLGAAYPDYLLSPSGSSTFWAQPQDGQNALYVGNASATNQKQIASLSPYTPFGWYTDSYLLVSQDSGLYVMPATGGTPLKITDYYKPLAGYNGYAGGYGNF